MSVIENKHSTEIGACLTLSVNAHLDLDTRRMKRRCNFGRVRVLSSPPAMWCGHTVPKDSCAAPAPVAVASSSAATAARF
jgi:hypothetical protein